ncbi:MAG: Tol-Pal system protein TolB, partial [Dokdonella sp.]
MTNRLLTRLGLAVMLLVFASGAMGQGLSIDITDGSRTADPVAVVPFAFEGAGLPPETDVAEIVRADLARSGKFFTLAKRDIVEFPTRESEVNFATWRLLKQNYLVAGRISDAGDG